MSHYFTKCSLKEKIVLSRKKRCWAVSGLFLSKNDVSLKSYLINNEVSMPQLKHLYYVPYGINGITDSVRSLILNYNKDNRETLALKLKSF